jgi:hypothetical protein
MGLGGLPSNLELHTLPSRQLDFLSSKKTFLFWLLRTRKSTLRTGVDCCGAPRRGPTMRWGSPFSYSRVSAGTELQSTMSFKSATALGETHFASNRQETWTQRHFRGWRFGILSGSVLAILVFTTNLTVTLVASLRQHRRISDRKILFEGDCTRTRNLNTGSHLLINVLSTLLLSASNYGMQCLSSPTRSEVDEAHAKRFWLDIGILSVRNTTKISKKRVRLWLLLAASSLPLHLL